MNTLRCLVDEGGFRVAGYIFGQGGLKPVKFPSNSQKQKEGKRKAKGMHKYAIIPQAKVHSKPYFPLSSFRGERERERERSKELGKNWTLAWIPKNL